MLEADGRGIVQKNLARMSLSGTFLQFMPSTYNSSLCSMTDLERRKRGSLLFQRYRDKTGKCIDAM